MRKLIGIIVIGIVAAIALGVGVAFWRDGTEIVVGADSLNAEQLALGAMVYTENCASCHGADLEGQPNWQIPLPTGGFPAPPHDETGHTWHHPDQQLIRITTGGFKVSDERGQMPAFGKKLTMEEIREILEFIKTWWSEDQRSYQATVTAEWGE
ncbi:MAG: cytochrome c [Chloroflexi bacterium]|nr:cytochrome c [Chloroflexota bacterium]